jgi:hypothetical protein
VFLRDYVWFGVVGALERLSSLTPAAGARHDEANMAAIDR